MGRFRSDTNYTNNNFTSFVSAAKIIDGETVLLTCEVNKRGEEPRKLTRILRITKDRIWNYTTTDYISNGVKGNNPIRPNE